MRLGRGVEGTLVESFRRRLEGPVIVPGDADYHRARRVYNGMIDRRPGLVACCRRPADVVAALRLLALGDEDTELPLAVRGGGHSGAGQGVCDGGVVLDLGGLRLIRVDAEARTVRVEGGATWGEVDRATHAYGMAVPGGMVSTTGVGGLTLGGGTGHLTRQAGLTIDSLLSAEVVLADGQQVTASEEEHADLFWALRGGGGNFGVVTSFEFRLRPVDTVVGGATLWPLEAAGEVLRWYRDYIADAPLDLNGFFAFLTVPPAPVFPAALHGQPMAAIVWCWTGPAARAAEVFGPVKAMKPALFGVHQMPYPALQSAFDALYPPGLQWYWRGDFFEDLPEAAIARHLEHGPRMPTALSSMHLYPIDGAVHHVDGRATAFSHRDAAFSQVIVGVDPDPRNREKITRWTKEYWEALHPYGTGGGYVNFLQGDEGPDRLRNSYRDNYPRLVEVKRRYDPENRFRVNHNIAPEAPLRAEPHAPMF